MKNFWNNRYIYAQYIALGATILSCVGFFLMMKNIGEGASLIGTLMFVVGMMLTCVSYCFGGLLSAIKGSLTIAKWGWLVVPFPYDIVTGILAFVVSIFAFFLVPIIPVRKACQQKLADQI